MQRGVRKNGQKKRGVTRQEVENLLMNPEQIVPGDQDALVAQVKRKGGLLRAPFVETEGKRKVLAVYWTSRVKKYWKEEQNADPI